MYKTEKHARLFLAFSISVCLGFLFFVFFGWEREVMFEFKNGNENNHWTQLPCVKYETVRTDWNTPHLIMR